MEDCLASYPVYAGQLAPLLRVAAKLERRGVPLLSAQGFNVGEARLLARAAELRPRQEGRAAVRAGHGPGLWAGMRRLVAAGVAVVVLLGVVLSAGTVSAASASMPGSRLYPLKRTTESLVSAAAFTPELKARVHLAWADRRLREIEAQAGQAGAVDEGLLTALAQETGQALEAAEQAGLEPLTAVAAHTEHQQAVLRRVLGKAPAAAQPGLERALEASAEGHARALSALEGGVEPGPPETPPGQAGDQQPSETQPETLPGEEASPPTSTPGVPDALTPAAKDHGQGGGPSVDQGTGQGQGQGQGQDNVTPPGQGQGHGNATPPGQGQGQGGGSDKDDQQPPGNGGGQGPPLDPGQGSGEEHGGGKPDKPDDPGQDKKPK